MVFEQTLKKGVSDCWTRKAHDWKRIDEYTLKCQTCGEEADNERYIRMKEATKQKGFFR